ncbi:MAG: hypothetical protein LBI43_03715 [Streptococcaceae bacterium]|nr:hypothetical protein [Streptococcaceae bacterium]
MAKPAAGTDLSEAGDGWWVEVVALTEADATTGASQHEKDAETGASVRQEAEVATNQQGQPDTSTGASQH